MDKIGLEAAEPARRPVAVAALLGVFGAVLLATGAYLLSVGDVPSIVLGACVVVLGVWAVSAAMA